MTEPAQSEEQQGTSFLQIYKAVVVPWYNNQSLGYNELVAKYIGLLSVLEKQDAQRYSAQALLGLRLLISGRLKTASQIFWEIEFQTSTAVAISYVMRGIGYFLRCLLTLIVLVSYPVYTVFYFSPAFRNNFSISFLDVLLATIFGMLGSVVSLLLRLGEFETTKGRSQRFLTFTGATLPVVGGVFGTFVAALLSSKIFNITFGNSDQSNFWLFVVIGFLSGFSERFSRGFIRIAENQFGAKGDSATGSGATPAPATPPPPK